MNKRELFEFRFDALMQAGSIGEIMVYSSIVSWKWRPDDPEVTATDFDGALKKVKDADRINLRINSPGGSVYQAVAMRAMMAQVTAKERHVYIEGLCASAATLLASVPGWTVHIAEGSSYMIHNPRSYAIGEASNLEKEAKQLRKMEGEFRAMYARRSGKDESTIKAWMDETHWFTASEAVAEGFADEVLESAEAVASAGVPEDAAALMRDMYGALPDSIRIACDKPMMEAERSEAGGVRIYERAGTPAPAGDGAEISNAGEAVAASPTPEHKQTDREEKNDMDMTTLTREQVMQERPDLFKEISDAGATAERERMQEIDDLTPPGYEQMAAEAKKSGENAMNYHKRVVKAQREKGNAFMEARGKETAPAQEIKGGASEDLGDMGAMDEADKIGKEIAALAPDGKEM